MSSSLLQGSESSCFVANKGPFITKSLQTTQQNPWPSFSLMWGLLWNDRRGLKAHSALLGFYSANSNKKWLAGNENSAYSPYWSCLMLGWICAEVVCWSLNAFKSFHFHLEWCCEFSAFTISLPIVPSHTQFLPSMYLALFSLPTQLSPSHIHSICCMSFQNRACCTVRWHQQYTCP